MRLSIPQKLITLCVVGVAATAFSSASNAAVNAEAAAALAKKSDCMRCHAIDKDKKATSFKKIAERWKGKPDAEAKLMYYTYKRVNDDDMPAIRRAELQVTVTCPDGYCDHREYLIPAE